MNGSINAARALHDAELVSVTLDRAQNFARLYFRQGDGATSLLKLHGVVAFRVEDLSLQNVVSRLLLDARNDLDRPQLAYWLEWATSLSDSLSWLTDERKTHWLDDVLAGRLEVLVIEPSAGAQVAAVCERSELVED